MQKHILHAHDSVFVSISSSKSILARSSLARSNTSTTLP